MDALTYISAFDKELAEKISVAFVARGARKGLIKKNAPNSYKDKRANMIWNAVMSNIAPVRVQMANTMFMSNELKAEFIELSKELETFYHALNTLAQKPFEFNLYAYNYDLEKMQKLLKKNG